MSFRFPMTLGLGVNRLGDMSAPLLNGYLTEVLGLKTVPQSFGPPKHLVPPLDAPFAKATFAVHLEAVSLGPGANELVEKMLKAIGQEVFQKVDSQAAFSEFKKILDFSTGAEAYTRHFSGDTEVWSFGPVSNFIEGSPEAVAQQKKKAWEFLKLFRSEVL